MGEWEGENQKKGRAWVLWNKSGSVEDTDQDRVEPGGKKGKKAIWGEWGRRGGLTKEGAGRKSSEA